MPDRLEAAKFLRDSAAMLRKMAANRTPTAHLLTELAEKQEQTAERLEASFKGEQGS
jgi:hypothetical protein